MKHIVSAIRRTQYGAVAALFLLTAVMVALPASNASAAGLLYRSLQLSSSQASTLDLNGAGGVPADPGEAANGDKVDHTYIFQSRTAATLRAIDISYCDSAFGYVETDDGESCDRGNTSVTGLPGFSADNAPSALIFLATNADLDNPTWPAINSPDATFAVDATATVANYLLVKDATGLAVPADKLVKVVFVANGSNYFVNPDETYTTNGGTFFGHITTYNSNATQDNTTDLDEGTVTSSTANTISINTRVQETLKFSTGGFGGSVADGAAAAANAPGGTCAALDTAGSPEGALSMGDANQALSTQTQSTTKSYFRIATNASRGAKVYYAGETLTSTAGDLIAPYNPGAAGAAGTEGFGLAVLADNAPANEGYTDMEPEADYDHVNNGNEYLFDTASNGAPVLIAHSDGVVACDTMAVEYKANIDNETPAGLYSTKVSYIAAPSY